MLRRLLAPVILLLLALTAGIWLGGHPDRLPAPVRNALIEKDFALVGEGLGVLDRRYYREPDQRAVADASLKAAVESLDDQYSAYLSPKDLVRFNEVTGAKPNAITSAAAAAAACGAPNSAGSASGLRSSPCSAAPERPSVAPIRPASIVRGKRMSRTMMPAGPSPDRSPAIAARGESPAGPTISETMARTRISAASARERPRLRVTPLL